MRALVVINTRSRSGEACGEAALTSLRARGIEAIPFEDRSGAATPPADAIVAVGGDGTLLRAIARALDGGFPVGIVPAGTFNDLARTLGVPLNVDDACAVVSEGRTVAIDVGVVNGVHYVNEASIGLSSRAARLQTGELKRRFGSLGIVASAFQALWYSRPMFAEVRYDGGVVRFRTIQLTVANSHRFGGVFNVSDAAIDDGWLDLYSVEIDSIWKAFPVANAILSGSRASVPGLRTLRSKQFVVRQHRPHHVTADGEPAGTTPATFDILPKALRVFVPQRSP